MFVLKKETIPKFTPEDSSGINNAAHCICGIHIRAGKQLYVWSLTYLKHILQSELFAHFNTSSVGMKLHKRVWAWFCVCVYVYMKKDQQFFEDFNHTEKHRFSMDIEVYAW